MKQLLFQPFYSSTGICTDSRNITEGCLFICLKGERFDGNTFAADALKQGASHVIVDNAEYFDGSDKMTLVEDSLLYLQSLANFHRNKFNIPVIGITGSNGKTTTKELINAVLSKKYNVLATLGNLNNHIGVPLTLLRLTEQHEIAIIEMGANRFKDIEELCDIADPNFGIITNIGKAHLEGFKSFEGVLNTKRELYVSIDENNGKIIINNDDETLKGIAPSDKITLRYGTSSECDVRGDLVELTPFVKMNWNYNGISSEDIETQLIGKYNFYNFLAAISFGVLFDIQASDISQAIREYSPTNNRSQVKKTSTNTLILDCYNANPTSMKSALESFAMNPHPNKVFILGDMKELGEDTAAEHLAIIKQIEQLELIGYTVGEEFGKIDSNNILRSFETSNDLYEYLNGTPITDRLILLKGSRSIGLEKLEDRL